MNDVSFTRTVRRAVQASREEASRLFHPAVDTHHILLGILRQDECDARVILDRLAIDCGALRRVLEERAPPGNPGASRLSDLPYTAGAQQAIERAVVACRELEHTLLGTGHLVLALLRAERGMAAESLREAGVTAEAIVEYLSPTGSREPSSEPSPRRPVTVTVTVEHRDGTMSTETFPSAFAAMHLFDLSRDTA